MRYRPVGGAPDDPRLGRLVPDDFAHLDRYPLAAMPQAAGSRPTPVVIGVNWYRSFSTPVRDDDTGEYWLGRTRRLGPIAGGHAVCLEPGESVDDASWWAFYDQGREGGCVGFAWSRCMSLLTKQIYAARWLWDRAKEADEWPDTRPGDDHGTSVRAAATVLRRQGHVAWSGSMADDDVAQRASYTADPTDGPTRVRWARSVREVHETLGHADADELEAVPVLNSWGPSYPRRVWMPDRVLERLIAEDGEIAVPTDR
jgi:hypothetical protein